MILNIEAMSFCLIEMLMNRETRYVSKNYLYVEMGPIITYGCCANWIATVKYAMTRDKGIILPYAQS